MHSCRPVNHPGSDKFQMSVLFLITDLLLSMTESVDTSAFPIPGYVITIILLFLLLCYPNPFPVWVCNNSYSEMTVLPVHCHKGHSIVIVKQESTVAINGFFHFRSIPVFDDCSKHFCHIFCYRQHSCSCMSANMRGNIGHSYWRLPDMAPDRHSLPGFYNLLP